MRSICAVVLCVCSFALFAEEEKAGNDPQFHKTLLEIAGCYERFGRVDDGMRWAPWLCMAPGPSVARVSGAKGQDGHSGKLYFVFASQRERYLKETTLRIQPDEGISLRIEAKVPGQAVQIQSVKMDFRYGSEFGGASPEAYERLLLDTMIGDATLFIRHDEAEQSWRFFDPILNAWKEENARYIPTYTAGTWGTKESDEMLLKDGRHWRRL